MKQRAESLIAGIELDRGMEAPLYRQIYDQIRRAILEQRLRPGTRLPASRVLAEQLQVSRSTALLAFDCLLSEGYVDGRPGSGTYVSSALPDHRLAVDPRRDADAPTAGPNISSRGWSLANAGGLSASKPRAFHPGVPAMAEFPLALWRRTMSRATRRLSGDDLAYGDPMGYRPLRGEIAAHLRSNRAVRCDAEQILIIGGSQQGIDLTARMLSDRGDRVWVEDPGYRGARMALEGNELELCPVPVDDAGIIVDTGRRLWPDARLAYVTPSHQFPMGATLTLARRLAVLAWAESNGAWIIEDDYDCEFRYGGNPLAALQGLDRSGRVIYIGTFSKSLFPALRIAYMVLPRSLLPAFRSAKAIIDRGATIVEQVALADFMHAGHFGRHIRRMRLLYQARQSSLLKASQAYWGRTVQLQPSDTGLHLTARLHAGVNDQEVSKAAASIGISAPALSNYRLQSQGPGLLLGYAGYSEAEIQTAAKSLAGILKSG